MTFRDREPCSDPAFLLSTNELPMDIDSGGVVGCRMQIRSRASQHPAIVATLRHLRSRAFRRRQVSSSAFGINWSD